MEEKLFDLNIKKILENWNISDAIREFISNALDEMKLTNTNEPEIDKEGNNWIIRDFGRGIQIGHLSQDESNEKKKHDETIGRFGIGLKDAIAVLFRNDIKFMIETEKYIMEPIEYLKNGFREKTIHMKISNQVNRIVGTKITIFNLKDNDMHDAKNNFIAFNKEKLLYSNNYGQILEKNESSIIYVSGMKIATNDSYTFSYNIKKINKKLESKLNRERKSLGRESYSEIIEKIIKNDIPSNIIRRFAEDKDNSGEMSKKSIRFLIFEKMNNENNYIFITEEESYNLSEEEKRIMSLEDKKIIIIKDGDKNIMKEKELYDYSASMSNYNDNFTFNAIDIKTLDSKMKNCLDLLHNIINKMSNKNSLFNKKIIIVDKNNPLNEDVFGYWNPRNADTIYIVKKCLNNLKDSIVTLIHELAHSIYGNIDSTRNFENDLSYVWYEFSLLNLNN